MLSPLESEDEEPRRINKIIPQKTQQRPAQFFYEW